MEHRRTYQHWPDRSRDEEPDEPVVTMQMRQVQLGTFDCGACQVAFSEKAIRFHTSEATRFQPHGYHKEIELEMTALTKIEIDKERGVMCVTGFFGYNVPEHYSSFSDGPKSRVLFHFVSGEGAGVWHGSDRANQTKSLMLLSPDIKQKTSFNPTGRDFAAELQRLKDGLGQQAATAATTKPPPTGKGSKSVPRQPGPYMIFCKAERSKVVAANPSMAFGEIGKELGAMWGRLSDAQKASYKDPPGASAPAPAPAPVPAPAPAPAPAAGGKRPAPPGDANKPPGKRAAPPSSEVIDLCDSD